MSMNLEEKKEKLIDYLKELGSVAVAYSSGVDSTFLLYMAKETLGENAIAVTAMAPSFPIREEEEAKRFCEENGITHVMIDFDPFSVDGFENNPPDRCYICKRELFREIGNAAREQGVRFVAEGSNLDDNSDYRPGMKAVMELGIKSPLLEAELTKSEIRTLSREMGLSTWDKPSLACLATRFEYGDTLTEEKLTMVNKAEEKLQEHGFTQVRVRVHGELARIEVPKIEFKKMMDPIVRLSITQYLKELGFMYVTLDTTGYETGSMNRQLD